MRLLKNFSLLGTVRLFNIGFPVVVIPLIIKSIGLEGYGTFSFYQAIIVFLSSIFVFGANTKGVDSLSKLQVKARKNYLSNILVVQFMLYSLLLLLFIFVNFSFDLPIEFWPFLFLFFANSYRITFTEFYFISGDMIINSIKLNFIFRSMVLVALLLFSDHFTTLLSITVLYSISAIIPGIFNIIWLKLNFRIDFKNIKNIIHENFRFVHSRIIISIKDKAGHFVLGFAFDREALAIYDIGLKIINVGAIPSSTLGQLFLKMKSNIVLKDLLNYLSKTLVISIISCIPLFLFRDFIIKFLKVNSLLFNSLAVYCSFGIICLSISSILGNNGLIKLNKDSYYLKSVYLTTIFYFAFLCYAIYFPINVNVSLNILAVTCATYFFEMIVRTFYLSNSFK